MQAEHIPVHLGAMPDAVAAVLGERAARPGDAWILNDPYRGGTHLPDITVVSPLFLGRRHVGFAAARAHHADVGGDGPGSMPADSTTLARGGRRDPADPARARLARSTSGCSTSSSRGCAGRASARPTCAHSWQPTGSRASALEELARRHGDGRCWRARWRRCSTTPSAARAPRSRRCPTARYRAADVLEDDGRRRAARPARSLRGARRAATRSRSTSPAPTADRRQPQLPAVGDEVGRLLRPAGADRPDIPPSAGAYRPVTVTRSGRVAW